MTPFYMCLRENAIGAAFSHFQFALNNLKFAAVFGHGDLCAKQPAGDEINGLIEMRRSGVNKKCGVVFGGVGVGVVADFLEQVAILFFGSPAVGTAGDEVLEQMG